MPKLPNDLTNILTPDDVGRLRAAYSREAFLGAAPRMIHYFKAGGLTDWLGQTVFNPIAPDKNAETSGAAAQTTITPGFREAVVLSVLATTQRDPLTMAAHIYWALMEGLSVENVADVFMTVGAYAGVDNFRFTTTMLEDVLTFLREFIKADKVATGQVLYRFNKIYAASATDRGRAAALLPDP